MDDARKAFQEKRDLLVAKLKEIVSRIENIQNPLTGEDRKIVMDMFQEVNITFLKDFDQTSLNLYTKNMGTPTQVSQ